MSNVPKSVPGQRTFPFAVPNGVMEQARGVYSFGFSQGGICGDGGNLICCDGCPSTFHQACLNILANLIHKENAELYNKINISQEIMSLNIKVNGSMEVEGKIRENLLTKDLDIEEGSVCFHLACQSKTVIPTQEDHQSWDSQLN